MPKNILSLKLLKIKIGLAVLKAMSEDGPSNDVNLLIKRYTLQIEKLSQQSHETEIDEWNFRDSILKCLYAKDIAYPKSKKILSLFLVHLKKSILLSNRILIKNFLFFLSRFYLSKKYTKVLLINNAFFVIINEKVKIRY